jgi:DNA helicase-2/ATP-dependent DNA helicase PcrA
MEEGLFPSSRSAESLADLEEERRLMYVAITRAKRAAMLSFAEMRRVWGKTENTSPSRFLREIDEQYIDANFRLAELRGRNRWERADVDLDDDDEPRTFKPQQRYDTRRGEVPMRRPMSQQQPQRPRPEIISTPKPLDPARAGMRSVGVRSDSQQAPVVGCAYSVGERVEHPKFGGGTIERIEALATDHKVVVVFDEYGSKTLLAKFAKLKKL